MTAIATLALLLLSSSAQEAEAQPGPEALKPLEFLIGTWTGQGVSPTAGKYTEQHVFEWMQGRSFIKAEYVMKTGDQVAWTATTIIGYDARKKKLVVFGFAKNGAVAVGEQVATDLKETWVFENKVSGLGAIEEDRVTQTKVDADTFTTLVEAKKEGTYAVLGKYTYTRKK